jgi:dipeptidyl aminopeptidase/acylaminoacyl peptidase
MLMIGAKDRRVPPFQAHPPLSVFAPADLARQSVEYHRALVARGIPSRMFVYPDCAHAIATPASEADAVRCYCC